MGWAGGGIKFTALAYIAACDLTNRGNLASIMWGEGAVHTGD